MMNTRTYLLISAAVFALIALLHLARLFGHWSIKIGMISIPIWGSWLGFIIAAGLSIWAFQLLSKWRGSH